MDKLAALNLERNECAREVLLLKKQIVAGKTEVSIRCSLTACMP